MVCRGLTIISRLPLAFSDSVEKYAIRGSHFKAIIHKPHPLLQHDGVREIMD
jgi:hypothetical protein